VLLTRKYTDTVHPEAQTVLGLSQPYISFSIVVVYTQSVN